MLSKRPGFFSDAANHISSDLRTNYLPNSTDTNADLARKSFNSALEILGWITNPSAILFNITRRIGLNAVLNHLVCPLIDRCRRHVNRPQTSLENDDERNIDIEPYRYSPPVNR